MVGNARLCARFACLLRVCLHRKKKINEHQGAVLLNKVPMYQHVCVCGSVLYISRMLVEMSGTRAQHKIQSREAFHQSGAHVQFHFIARFYSIRVVIGNREWQEIERTTVRRSWKCCKSPHQLTATTSIPVPWTIRCDTTYTNTHAHTTKQHKHKPRTPNNNKPGHRTHTRNSNATHKPPTRTRTKACPSWIAPRRCSAAARNKCAEPSTGWCQGLASERLSPFGDTTSAPVAPTPRRRPHRTRSAPAWRRRRRQLALGYVCVTAVVVRTDVGNLVGDRAVRSI